MHATPEALRIPVRSRALVDAVVVWVHLPLMCILTLQGAVSLVFLQNSAFQDEALYLYAGSQVLAAARTHAPLIDPFPSYLSGNPYFYPLVASLLNAWGGLEAARMLSLVAILGTTACVYWIANHLYDRQSAIFGTAVFAFQGSVLFLGRLATYDACCLLLLAVSTVLALRAGVTRTPLIALGIGPLLMLAFLTKYAALLWVPSVLAILAWSTLQRQGWQRMAVHVMLAVASLVASAGLVLAVLDRSFLHAVQGSTTNRVIAQEAPRLALAWEVIALGGIGLSLAFIGCLLVVRGQRLQAVILFGSSLLAPAYHIYKMEPVSLDKHVAYGLFFAAPLAGTAVARFASAYGHSHSRAASSELGVGPGWLPALALCLIISMLGIQQGTWEYHTWGDATGMADVLRALVRPAGGRYLAEDMEVARYYLQDVTDDWQWTGPFWFTYTNKAHQYFSGTAAYKAALADGYFDAVELSYSNAAPLDIAIQSELRGRHSHYELVAKVPYRDVYTGYGFYWIWRLRVPGASAPPSTSG